MTTTLRVDTAGTRGQTAAFSLAGDLDLHTAPVLYPTVEDVLGSHPTVIMDLTGITFCDSSGLNALIRLRRRAQEAGGDLILVAPSQQMLRLLSITGAARIFTIHAGLPEAWNATPDPGTPPTP
ncbi:STAS domain-containing protein [Streptomyces sp. H39-S7]|uniref:STAS domain-containing protein n=1 Tax=Streptomyces sp. H39-S7 TaxID=3004357 RepID=UPI0022AFD999|nr:STAS domain-containing protein [Streptomyces sp. H39-S7]MCZ4124603.1 STAS domain-containing protein [Streptomyces sp. H39-S7]